MRKINKYSYMVRNESAVNLSTVRENLNTSIDIEDEVEAYLLSEYW